MLCVMVLLVLKNFFFAGFLRSTGFATLVYLRYVRVLLRYHEVA